MTVDTQKYIVIIRGLSGSGKRTVADFMCDGDTDECRRVAISANDYFYNEEDEFEFDSSKLKDAHHWCLREVEVCALQGYDLIVVHNSFTRRWEVEPYFRIAEKNGYRISVLSMYDSGLNDMQLANRSEHTVPLHSIRNQRKRWELDVFREQTRGNINGKADAKAFRRRNFKA